MYTEFTKNLKEYSYGEEAVRAAKYKLQSRNVNLNKIREIGLI